MFQRDKTDPSLKEEDVFTSVNLVFQGVRSLLKHLFRERSRDATCVSAELWLDVTCAAKQSEAFIDSIVGTLYKVSKTLTLQ